MVGGGAQIFALAAFRPIPGESSAFRNPSPYTQRITEVTWSEKVLTLKTLIFSKMKNLA